MTVAAGLDTWRAGAQITGVPEGPTRRSCVRSVEVQAMTPWTIGSLELGALKSRTFLNYKVKKRLLQKDQVPAGAFR